MRGEVDWGRCESEDALRREYARALATASPDAAIDGLRRGFLQRRAQLNTPLATLSDWWQAYTDPEVSRRALEATGRAIERLPDALLEALLEARREYLAALGDDSEDSRTLLEELRMRVLGHSARETSGWVADLRGLRFQNLYPRLAAILERADDT